MACSCKIPRPIAIFSSLILMGVFIAYSSGAFNAYLFPTTDSSIEPTDPVGDDVAQIASAKPSPTTCATVIRKPLAHSNGARRARKAS